MRRVVFVLVFALFVARALAGGETPPLDPGKWEGEWLGATGERGRLTLSVSVDGESIHGKYSLAPSSEDKAPKPIEGRFEGKRDGAAVSFEVTIRDKKRHFAGRLMKADPHAVAALAGLVEDDPGGVWIVWRYAD